MKAALVALLLNQLAFVDERRVVATSDAPVAEESSPIAVIGSPLAPEAIEVHAGDLVPFDGACFDKALTVATGKRIVACEATLAKAQEDFLISKPVLIGGLVGAFVLGGVIAGAIAAAVKK